MSHTSTQGLHGTSLGGGRNVLYDEAMKKEQVYLYFIILDDDIINQKETQMCMHNNYDSCQ